MQLLDAVAMPSLNETEVPADQLPVSKRLFASIDRTVNNTTAATREGDIRRLEGILSKGKFQTMTLREHDRMQLSQGIAALQNTEPGTRSTFGSRMTSFFSPRKQNVDREKAGGFVRSLTNGLPTSKVASEDTYYRDMSNAVYYRRTRPEYIGPYKYEPVPSNKRVAVYEDDKKHEIVVAFRGTTNKADLRTDIHVLTGRLNQSRRYNEDKAVVRRLLAQNPNSSFVFTGHSLGGSIAIALMRAYHTRPNLRAVVFNPGVGFAERADKSLPIRMYHVKGDAVSVLGARLFKDVHVIDSGHTDPIRAHKLHSLTGGALIPSHKMEASELGPMIAGATTDEELKDVLQRFAMLWNAHAAYREKRLAEKTTRAEQRKEDDINNYFSTVWQEEIERGATEEDTRDFMRALWYDPPLGVFVSDSEDEPPAEPTSEAGPSNASS